MIYYSLLWKLHCKTNAIFRVIYTTFRQQMLFLTWVLSHCGSKWKKIYTCTTFKCWAKNTHTHIHAILFDITFCVCRCLSIANVFFHSAFDVYILNVLAARDFFFVLRGLFNNFIDIVATSVFELHRIHGIKSGFKSCAGNWIEKASSWNISVKLRCISLTHYTTRFKT